MGNLPKARVQPARPFINAGVDFCGPIWTHFKIRGKRPVKSYVAVFCCFATKAVHLEVVSDLTSEGFIGALKRFCGRRGKCRHIYCDNATNFVGAKNQLEELEALFKSQQAREKIQSMCTSKGIDFHFIPPRAPHFGGLWEAAVKSAKQLLHRTVAAAALTYEELSTVMVEIEAILNSRPLTPLSEDPNDLTALTPGHFTIGEPLTAIMEPATEETNSSLVRRWKLVNYIKQEFWRRWSREYLSELQQRWKWKHQWQNAQPGMMVIIKEDNAPPLKWHLGRILQTIKGDDNLVRVAKVQTASGEITRPIHRLCPLPVDTEETEPQTKDKPVETTPPKYGAVPRTAPSRPSKGGRFLPINPNWQQTIQEQREKTAHDNVPREEVPEPEIRTKRRRCVPNSLLTLALLTILVLPILGRTIPSVEIQRFNSQPGIYFENLGLTDLIVDEWNLIVFYDLRNYWSEMNAFQEGLDAMSKQCKISEQKAYEAMLLQFHHHLNQIKDNNELLLESGSKQRKKRSPFDIIGTIANKLFGVLDQEYADRISQVITEVQANENHVLELMKNQTSIIESTIHVVKENEEIIQKQFGEFSKQLEKLTGQIYHLEDELHYQEIMLACTNLAVHSILIMNNFQQIQNALLNIITDVQHGKMNSLILTPKQLKVELTKIKDHLPPTLRLPEDHHKIDLQELYSLMTVQSRTTLQHIIFHVRLPLLSKEQFELYNVVPVPSIVNDTFFIIKPSTTHLMANLHRDHYYPMTKQETADCHRLQIDRLICRQHHPLYSKPSTISHCEITLLDKQPMPPSCEILHISKPSRWIQLSNPNQWIYVMETNTTLNIVCGTQTTHWTFFGTGLLTLKDNCVLKDESTMLTARRSHSSQIRASFFPAMNLTIQTTMKKNDSEQLQIQTFNLTHIEDVLKQLEDLKSQMHLTPTRPQDIHHFTLGYILLGICIAAAAYFWINKKNNKRTQPTPRPRTIHQRKEAKEFRFNLN